MNQCNSGRRRLAAAVLLVLVGALPAPAQTQGLSLTVGLTTSCPYGPAFG